MLQLTIPISSRRGPRCTNVNLEWHAARSAPDWPVFRCYCAWNKGKKSVCGHARTHTDTHTHSHVRQSHEITQADQDDMPVGVLMKDAWWDTSWESEFLCHQSKTSKSHTLSREKKTHKRQFAIIRNYISFKKKKIMSFDFRKWWKK